MKPQLTVEESTIWAAWASFLRDYYAAEIQRAAEEAERSVVVSFKDVDVRDPGLADKLLHKPRLVLQLGERVMFEEIDVTVEPKPRLFLRVKDLPPAAAVTARQLRAEHQGRLVVVEGLVKKTVEVRPMVLEAAFDCNTCGNRGRLLQHDVEDLVEPVICDGCEKKDTWTVRYDESRLIDHQKILLQENPENLRGAQAAEVTVYLQEDLVARVEAGKRARITGILTPLAKRKDRRLQRVLDQFLQAVHVEVLEQTIEDVVVTPDEEVQLRELAARPGHWERVWRSYAPQIHGLELPKQAILLALFSGRQTTPGPEPRKRMESHVLLVGDSALAKTELLRFGNQLLPRSRFADAPNATGVGLTAAAVHDDFGGSRWTIEAGAAPMADGSALFVDEVDKTRNPDDLAKLLGLLESGRINFDKAGLSTTLSARIRLIAASNPKDGRFDPHEKFADQIGGGVAFLDRCDLIIALRDVADFDNDLAVARAIGRGFQDGAGAGDEDLLDVVTLRKLLAVALRYTPTLPDDVVEALAQRYAAARRQAAKLGQPLPRNARSSAGAIRLARASARLHLRPAVTMDDVELVMRVSDAALHSIGVIDDRGVADVVVLAGGRHATQARRIEQVFQVICELAGQNPKGYALVDDVVAKCKAVHSLEEREVRRDVKTLIDRPEKASQRCWAKGGGATVAPLH